MVVILASRRQFVGFEAKAGGEAQAENGMFDTPASKTRGPCLPIFISVNSGFILNDRMIVTPGNCLCWIL
jgi:hypothetical protein